jgi:hypothetical protein
VVTSKVAVRLNIAEEPAVPIFRLRDNILRTSIITRKVHSVTFSDENNLLLLANLFCYIDVNEKQNKYT